MRLEMLEYSYAFKNISKEKSSSGGAFPSIVEVFAKHHLHENGFCVFGASFDKDFSVKHIEINNLNDLTDLCGSKYVKSNIDGIYDKVRIRLQEGNDVIFSGTPCQVFALKKYLKNKCKQDRLVTIDIVCHGTIMPIIWLDYRKWLTDKYNSSIVDFSFRYQSAKWKSYPSMVTFANGKKYVNSFDLRRYTEIFYSDLALTPACYNCQFANQKRVSDITIGDFWGIRKVLPSFPYKESVSEIIPNTNKGKIICDLLYSEFDGACIEKCKTSDLIRFQESFNKPTPRPYKTTQFLHDYSELGFQYVLEKYFGYNMFGFFKHCLLRFLGESGIITIVKNVLKR